MVMYCLSLCISTLALGANKELPFHNFQEQIVSNISASNGEQWCKEHVPTSFKTCIPVKNNSDKTNLFFEFPDEINGIIKPGKVDAFLGVPFFEKQPVTVQDDSTNKIIFNGVAKNKVGLLCDSNSCREWR